MTKNRRAAPAPFQMPDNFGMELREIRVLRKNKRNAKTHPRAQIDSVKASILEFGWTMPILIDEHESMSAGHARLDAAEEIYADGKTIKMANGVALPPGTVPVVRAVGWSEAQKLAYLEADNRLTEMGGYDNDLRRSVLSELSEAGFDMAAIGWGDGEELADFLAGPQAPAEFQALGDDIPTEHQCPSCGYRWSGKFSGLVPAARVDGDAPTKGAKARR